MNTILHHSTSSQILEVLMQSDVATAIYETDEIIISFANDAMISFWGKDRSIIGKPLIEAVPELRDQPFKKMLQKVLNTGITDSGVTPATTLVNGKLQTAYYDYQYKRIAIGLENSLYIIHTAKDVTEYQLTEQEKQRLSTTLFNLNADLVSSNKELVRLNKDFEHAQEELKNTILQLEESEIALRLAVEAADFGTWHIHSKTREFITSPRLRELFGYLPDDNITIEDALAQITDDYRRHVTLALENAIYKGGDYDVTYPVIGFNDQKLRWLRAIGNLKINTSGEYSDFTGVVMDVSELKKDEQRKNDFIAMVSHELKTPLTSLNAYLQIMQVRTSAGTDLFTSDVLNKSVKQIKRMTTMINGFLTISKLESGKIHLNRKHFELTDLLSEIQEEAKTLHPSHLLIFHYKEKIVVNADQDKIGHVITNLISNAGKYSKPFSEIIISCEKVNETAVVSVKDAGIGIREKDIAKLFERYYRVEESLLIAGFGIGLYLSSDIIERHSGKIWVESIFGEGSTFYFSIPLS